jgi:Uma2 family endonuclease
MGELELPELPKHRMTVDEFFDWWDAHGGDYKYELIDGYVQFKYRDPEAMGRDRNDHNLLKLQAALLLRSAIRKAGLECKAFSDGTAVVLPDGQIRLPDALVHCGPFDPNKSSVDAPVIVIEVISPSSGERDQGPKFVDYASVASIQHYLVIFPEKKMLIRHSRLPDDRWATTFVREGEITLDPPGLALSVSEFFEEAA